MRSFFTILNNNDLSINFFIDEIIYYQSSFVWLVMVTVMNNEFGIKISKNDLFFQQFWQFILL